MPSRRQFLGRAGAIAGMGAIPTLAGCVSGRGSELAAYTDWLAAPDLFGGRRYFFDYYDVAAIRDQQTAFDPAVYDAYRTWATDGYDHFGLSFRAVDEELLSVNRRVTVLTGEWDRNAVGDHLQTIGYVPADPHAGYDRYRHRLAELAVAVGKRRLLRARRTDRSPLGTVTLFVDTGAGESRRYVDSDVVLSELTRQLGNGTYVYGLPHPRIESTEVERGRFRGARARGLARTVESGETTDRVVVVFRDEEDLTAAMADLEAWTRTAFFDGSRSVDISTAGPSAVVTVRRPTADLNRLAPLVARGRSRDSG